MKYKTALAVVVTLTFCLTNKACPQTTTNRLRLVWVRFDNPSIGFQTDIYDHQLEKV